MDSILQLQRRLITNNLIYRYLHQIKDIWIIQLFRTLLTLVVPDTGYNRNARPLSTGFVVKYMQVLKFDIKVEYYFLMQTQFSIVPLSSRTNKNIDILISVHDAFLL
jgi:hypothetical protein